MKPDILKTTVLALLAIYLIAQFFLHLIPAGQAITPIATLILALGIGYATSAVAGCGIYYSLKSR